MKKEKYKPKVSLGIRCIIAGLIIIISGILESLIPSDILIFLFSGIMSIAAGTVYIIYEEKKSDFISHLIKNNKYVYADFESIKLIEHKDTGSHDNAYFAIFRYTDDYGNVYHFNSENYSNRSTFPYKPGDSVKVYADLSTPKIYMISSYDTIYSDVPYYSEKSCFSGKSKYSFSDYDTIMKIISCSGFIISFLSFIVSLLPPVRAAELICAAAMILLGLIASKQIFTLLLVIKDLKNKCR